MRSLRFFVSCLSLLVLSSSLHAETLPSTKVICSTAEKNGMKIVVDEARWLETSTLSSTQIADGFVLPRAVFCVRFRLVTKTSLKLKGGNDPNNNVRVYAVSPEGKRILSNFVHIPLNDDQKNDERGSVRVWDEALAVDPRWKQFTLQFEYIDASQSRFFRGRKPVEKLKIAELPLAQAGAPRELNLVATTQLGVRVEMKKVILKKRSGKTEMMYFVGRALPPIDDPAYDPRVELGQLMREPRERYGFHLKVEYSNPNGEIEQAERADIMYGKNDDVLKDRSPSTPGYFSIYATPPTNASAKATLYLEVTDQSTTEWKPDTSNTFSFVLKQNDIVMPEPRMLTSDDKPFDEAPLGNAKVSIWPLRAVKSRFRAGEWRAQMILHASPKDKAETWVCTDFLVRAGDATLMAGVNGGWLLWKDDGTPLKEKEKLWHLQPAWFPNERSSNILPLKVTIQTEWKQSEQTPYLLSFLNLPVPGIGEVQNVDRVLDAGDWGQFVVRKVGWSTEEKPLSNTIRERMSKMMPPQGLSVVVEYLPSAKAQESVWEERTKSSVWSFKINSARDAKEYPLRRYNDDSLEQIQWLDGLSDSGQSPQGHFLTIHLLPPPKSKTFTLNLEATREVVLQRQTIVFKEMDLPRPVSSDK